MNYQLKIENFKGSPRLFGAACLFLESFKLKIISDLPKTREKFELMHDDKDLKMFAQDHAIE